MFYYQIHRYVTISSKYVYSTILLICQFENPSYEKIRKNVKIINKTN